MPLATRHCALGAAVSGLLLGLDGAMGFKGWQWLFIIEGVPSILLGIVTWFYPTDRPERADWLSAGQKAWLASKLDAGIAAKQAVKRMTLGEALSSPKVFALSLIAALPLIAGLLVLFGGRESKAEFADSGKVA